VNITILFVQHEVFSGFFFDRLLDSFDTISKPFEDSLDITTFFHGDDTKLIFFIYPGKESLCVIMEDTTSLWPISLHTSNLEIPVTRYKEEMVIHELLPDLLLHTSKRVVGTSKLPFQVSKSLLHQFLNSNTLFLGNTRRQTKSIN